MYSKKWSGSLSAKNRMLLSSSSSPACSISSIVVLVVIIVIVVPIIISPKVVFLYPCHSIGLKGCFASNEKLVWGQRWLHMMTLLARGKSFLAMILQKNSSQTTPFDVQDFQVRCWHRVNIVRAACNGGEIKIEVGFIITIYFCWDLDKYCLQFYKNPTTKIWK